jgi:hypothetical protein
MTMAQCYRVTAVKPGRSVALIPRAGSADPAGVIRLVLHTPKAGRGRLQVGKAIRIGIRPKPVHPVAKGRAAKRPRRYAD